MSPAILQREAASSELSWPKPLVVGTPATFIYEIVAESQGELRQLKPFEEGSGNLRVQASRYMEVTLGGGPFKFDPAGPVRKDLGTSNSGSWSWNVTPQEPGEHAVSVIVTNLHREADGSFTPMPATRPERFLVKVSAREMTRNEAFRAWLADWDSTTAILTKLVGSLAALIAAFIGLKNVIRRLMRDEDAPPAAKGTK